MASCQACGFELPTPSAGACPRCGASSASGKAAVPVLELDVPARRRSKPTAPKRALEPELAIELAVDPRARAPGAVFTEPSDSIEKPPTPSALAAKEAEPPDPHSGARSHEDVGKVPRNWWMTPFYAWRLLARQRASKEGLAAMANYDAKALRTGIFLLGFAGGLALSLLVLPIVWRATRVVDPPVPAATPAR